MKIGWMKENGSIENRSKHVFSPNKYKSNMKLEVKLTIYTFPKMSDQNPSAFVKHLLELESLKEAYNNNNNSNKSNNNTICKFETRILCWPLFEERPPSSLVMRVQYIENFYLEQKYGRILNWTGHCDM